MESAKENAMRRDERPFEEEEGESEIAAIEMQWTKKWEELGGPKLEFDTIRRREEFHILDGYVRDLPKGARLLDGGCGMGYWTVYFSKMGYPTLGLDVSRATIDKLKKLFPAAEFAVGDIRATGLAEGSYDLYFSWGTFEHFEEGFGPVLSEAYRLLKPGGRLLISTPFDNLRLAFRSALFDEYQKVASRERSRFYQWRLTRGEMARVLTQHGFDVERVYMIHKRQGLMRWLQNMLGLSVQSTLNRGAAFALTPFVPAVVFAHMILGVATKPRK